MMYSYCKQLETKYDVDICVVGGGPAGIAAGVTAARQGFRVLILESQGFFGGAATAALVPAFMQFSDGVHFMAGGFGREIYDKICTEPKLNLGIRTELLKRVYDDIVAKSGARFLFFANVCDVIRKSDRIEAVIVSAKSGLYAVRANIFIDASGDGDLCARAGAPFDIGDTGDAHETMPATLCSQWVNVDWDRFRCGNENREFERAYADGVFSQEDWHIPGLWRTGENIAGGNVGHCYHIDATDEASLTEAMVLGRKLLPEYERYYREYIVDGCEQASIINSASCLGVRESRRIRGDYVLCAADFRGDSQFTDEIGRYSYPVDIHSGLGRTAYEKFKKEHGSMVLGRGENYSIPYRSLLPVTLENVYVAGRCMSTDRQMQSSIRVMPCCFITGQACGMAAAMTCENGNYHTRDIDISVLQSRLRKMGAYLSESFHAD